MGRSPRFTLDQISKLGRKAQEGAAEQLGYGRKDTNDHTVVGYFQGDKTRNSLTQKAEQSDTK